MRVPGRVAGRHGTHGGPQFLPQALDAAVLRRQPRHEFVDARFVPGAARAAEHGDEQVLLFVGVMAGHVAVEQRRGPECRGARLPHRIGQRRQSAQFGQPLEDARMAGAEAADGRVQRGCGVGEGSVHGRILHGVPPWWRSRRTKA
ncbi:hypothetical protein HK414_20850 [Ramlibacter terrae]|uniref:Uncharacterized protein n=1 Tax=Ramlibacter terrae TaxID=2732511 RepID=A0ABX6P113_9BURK|nr:hypothetical protein HK414_20850 [Ramlibacter terrae]